MRFALDRWLKERSFMHREIVERIIKFRDDRDWRQFHTPKNLAMSLAVEAAELMEIFQWARDDEIEQVARQRRQAIEDEIADIAIFVHLFCHDLDIDLENAIRRKLETNAKKYPVEKARGSSRKYNADP
jgi:NTP pyrophosphatase (non-canonical NTP hydrolase)